MDDFTRILTIIGASLAALVTLGDHIYDDHGLVGLILIILLVLVLIGLLFYFMDRHTNTKKCKNGGAPVTKQDFYELRKEMKELFSEVFAQLRDQNTRLSILEGKYAERTKLKDQESAKQ